VAVGVFSSAWGGSFNILFISLRMHTMTRVFLVNSDHGHRRKSKPPSGERKHCESLRYYNVVVPRCKPSSGTLWYPTMNPKGGVILPLRAFNSWFRLEHHNVIIGATRILKHQRVVLQILSGYLGPFRRGSLV